jgi:hypothetical protein
MGGWMMYPTSSMLLLLAPFMGGNKMATNKQPANTLRCGGIRATIWQNVSENGPFFTTIFSRPFKDQSGEWHNGTSFGLIDLEALMNVALEAKEWIVAHALKY